MFPGMEKHGPLQGGQPQQFEARNPLPAHPATPIDEYSALIEALHSFAPDTFEVGFSEQSCTRSIEIGSVEVWERFVATLRPESATRQNTETRVLHNFIEDKLRFWIDLHPRGRRCLLHLKMIGLRHEMFLDTFMKSAQKRLDALPRLFPNNNVYLDELRGNIDDTRSGSWRRLSDRMPDSTLSFDGATYGFPGFIIEVGDSQNWERKEGVKNKAVQYEDDSEGMIAGVLYLGYGDRSIGMIGSKSVFPSCPLVKYLDGTLSTHAVDVIPLTSLTDPVYSECLLLLKFAYFGAGRVLLRSLEPQEQEMGFFFTFKEILQMIEMVDKKVPSSPRLVDAAEKYDPLERQKPWNSVATIRASLFTTPPDSLPYCPAQAYGEDSVGDLSSDEDVDEENSSPSDWSPNKERNDIASTSLRKSARLATRPRV